MIFVTPLVSSLRTPQTYTNGAREVQSKPHTLHTWDGRLGLPDTFINWRAATQILDQERTLPWTTAPRSTRTLIQTSALLG